MLYAFQNRRRSFLSLIFLTRLKWMLKQRDLLIKQRSRDVRLSPPSCLFVSWTLCESVILHDRYSNLIMTWNRTLCSVICTWMLLHHSHFFVFWSCRDKVRVITSYDFRFFHIIDHQEEEESCKYYLLILFFKNS